MSFLWSRLKAVPAGFWAACGAAIAILFLFMRGRRLEGELASAKVSVEVARARVEVQREHGAAAVHMQIAAQKGQQVLKLEEVRVLVREKGAAERKKLAAMSPKELDEAYLQLAKEERPRDS